MFLFVKLDSKYFCINHLCEICVNVLVKRIIIHLKMDMFLDFLLPVNIVVGFVLQFLRKDYWILIAIFNFLVLFGLYH